MDGKPILSCSMLAARASGHSITTLEGVQEEAKNLCGLYGKSGSGTVWFLFPRFIMNVLAMDKELTNPSEEEINRYLAGNLLPLYRLYGTASCLKRVFKP